MPLPQKQPRSSLDVVIVNWDHELTLPACLRSLSDSVRSNYCIDRIVVVDNSRSPTFRADRYDGLPDVTVVPSSANVGFAAGCNRGARHSEADYLLFLNPDTQVGPRSIASAVAVLEDPASAGIALLGPLVVDRQGRQRITGTRLPTVGRVFNRITGLSLLMPRWFPGMWMIEPHQDEARLRLVDCVSGVCLFVRRSVFEQLGGFDERLFLYYEDADLSLRARRLGWSTAFLADDPVVHDSGWSRGDDRAWRLAHSWRSLMMYAWKAFGPVRAVGVTAIVLVLAPAARLSQAVWHLSPRETVAAFVGYAWLWSLLARDLVTRTRTIGAAGQESGATSQAKSMSGRCGTPGDPVRPS
ncbi:MAG: glycosyltransferase family 2 protein [Vicinamibacterales bacterium]